MSCAPACLYVCALVRLCRTRTQRRSVARGTRCPDSARSAAHTTSTSVSSSIRARPSSSAIAFAYATPPARTGLSNWAESSSFAFIAHQTRDGLLRPCRRLKRAVSSSNISVHPSFLLLLSPLIALFLASSHLTILPRPLWPRPFDQRRHRHKSLRSNIWSHKAPLVPTYSPVVYTGFRWWGGRVLFDIGESKNFSFFKLENF